MRKIGLYLIRVFVAIGPFFNENSPLLRKETAGTFEFNEVFILAEDIDNNIILGCLSKLGFDND